MLLHEGEDVERLDLAVGVEAVDGVMHIGEDLEAGCQLGHHQQLDVAAVEVDQFEVAALLAQAGGQHHQRAQPRAVDVVHMLQIEHHPRGAATGQRADFLAQS